ncbi:solute carrier family 22 member 6-like isoform X2 [Macrobrachium nipponense]|uniref:solute carrier family 22 member 6-like isoform X2 n=1 Tax=Macrobrachium nipponense TaxID=159736 RepID=UPI0030C7E07F
MISTLDELLAELGTGWWDVIHYVVAIFCLSLPASQALGGAFYAPAVDYTCVPTAPSAASETGAEGGGGGGGGPSSWRLKDPAPENSTALNRCSYLMENVQTGEVIEESCSEWLFDNSTFATTVTSEFQLTCDRAYLRATYQSIYMLGMFIGALISGFAADRMMDESPRWLAVTGRHERALEVLKKAARLNRTSLPGNEKVLAILRESKEEESVNPRQEKKGIKVMIQEQLASLSILLRTPKLRRTTLALYCSYVIVNMSYYGLSLSGGNLSNDPFVFMVLSGLMEVPAYSLTVPLVAHFGRRMPTLVSFALSGVALLAIAPTPPSHGWLVMTLAMVGKVCIASAYQILIFYSTELFPTEVRSRGVGTCFMISRLGSIVSPFINEILGSVYPWAPSAVFGATAFVAGLVMLMLPETMGVALPETVAELEARDMPSKKRSWLRIPTSEEKGGDKQQEVL